MWRKSTLTEKYLAKIGHFQRFTEGFDDAAFETHNQCSRRFLERYNFHAERHFQVSVAGQVEGFQTEYSISLSLSLNLSFCPSGHSSFAISPSNSNADGRNSSIEKRAS